MAVRSVLVLNAGSSSLKWVVLDAQSEAVQDQGEASWQGAEGGRHQAELEAALERVPEIQAVGHRGGVARARRRVGGGGGGGGVRGHERGGDAARGGVAGPPVGGG